MLTTLLLAAVAVTRALPTEYWGGGDLSRAEFYEAAVEKGEAGHGDKRLFSYGSAAAVNGSVRPTDSPEFNELDAGVPAEAAGPEAGSEVATEWEEEVQHMENLALALALALALSLALLSPSPSPNPSPNSNPNPNANQATHRSSLFHAMHTQKLSARRLEYSFHKEQQQWRRWPWKSTAQKYPLGSCDTGCLDFKTKEMFTATLGPRVGNFWTKPGVYSFHDLRWMGPTHKVCPYGCRYEHDDAGPQYPAFRHCRPSTDVVAPCSKRIAEVRRPARWIRQKWLEVALGPDLGSYQNASAATWV